MIDETGRFSVAVSKTNFTYAIADLHGRHDLLVAAYAAIKQHANGAPARIVHLGDYVDRGPQSRHVIEFLMDRDTLDYNFERVVLRGNHEEIMVYGLRTPGGIGHWLPNGGGATLLSYGHAPEGVFDPTVVPQSHVDFLLDLPVAHLDAPNKRVFVHAMFDPALSLGEQKDVTLTWGLYPKGAGSNMPDGMWVIHGHEQHKSGPKTYDQRLNLDTMAFASGRIVVGVFDDAVPGGPVDFIEIKGEPDTRWG